jgi:hypothetical protein
MKLSLIYPSFYLSFSSNTLKPCRDSGIYNQPGKRHKKFLKIKKVKIM